jgi:hypothetical protein
MPAAGKNWTFSAKISVNVGSCNSNPCEHGEFPFSVHAEPIKNRVNGKSLVFDGLSAFTGATGWLKASIVNGQSNHVVWPKVTIMMKH